MNLTIWIVVAVGVLVLAVGGFVVLRSNRRPKEEPILHFTCPGCRQRLGYRARQVPGRHHRPRPLLGRSSPRAALAERRGRPGAYRGLRHLLRRPDAVVSE